MRIIQLLFLPSSVIGFPQLLTRASGDADPVSDGLGILIGGAATLFGGLGTAAVNLFQKPDDSDQSTTQPTTTDEIASPDTESSPATPSITSGAVDIYLTVSAEPETATPLPASNENCDPSQASDQHFKHLKNSELLIHTLFRSKNQGLRHVSHVRKDSYFPRHVKISARFKWLQKSKEHKTKSSQIE